MAIHQLTLDLYADVSTEPTTYRVYVDSDLLTERDWVWPAYEIFVREHLVVDVPPGEHTIRVITVSGPANITTKRLTLDDQEQDVKLMSFRSEK